MKIQELSVDCRPRERMYTFGPSSLSNAELLAILLRCGTRDCSAIDLAHRLLSGGGSLCALSTMGLDRMCSVPGMGRAKAAQVAAALELGRRFICETSAADSGKVLCPRTVFDYMVPIYKGLDREQCWVIFLSASNRIIARERLTEGDSASTAVDVPRIVRMALDKGARGVIITHNHPSGNPSPSAADLESTSQLKAALGPFGIALMDHIVVSDSAFYSFADEHVYRF